jgi:hypothetical protein
MFMFIFLILNRVCEPYRIRVHTYPCIHIQSQLKLTREQEKLKYKLQITNYKLQQLIVNNNIDDDQRVKFWLLSSKQK